MLLCSTYVWVCHHAVSLPHPPCHQGQSVLHQTKALCRKRIGVFHVTCFVCQLGFANALLLYSESVMNQTLVVNWLTLVFYNTAYYNIWTVLSWLQPLMYWTLSDSLLGKPSLVPCCNCWCSGPTWFRGIGCHNTELACHQGQSVLHQTKALCRKRIGVFHVTCFVCQLGFANALLLYSESVMNQTLAVN